MKTAFDYTSTITSRDVKDLGRQYLGPIYNPKFPISGYITHTISLVEQYRPDKIAYLYYGNVDLHWVIDVVNNFYNGFSEYTEGTQIKVPTPQTLFEMGIVENSET
jgi:hypothetical protein